MSEVPPSQRPQAGGWAPGSVRRAAGRVHPTVELLGAYSWWLILIGIVGWVVLSFLGRISLVVYPLLIGVLLTVVLSGPAQWLRRHGWPPLLATWAVFLGFLVAVALVGALIVPPLGDEFSQLGPTIDQAVEDIKDWLVEDSPFDLTRQRLDELEQQGRDAIERAGRRSGPALLRSARVLFEVLAGILLALVITFFLVKDGDRFQRLVLRQLPEDRRPLVRRLAGRAWRTLGGYLKGSAALGVIEGVIIASVLAIVGARLIVPVAVLTFLAAFVPFVGAVTAGIVATLVALVTAGFTPAIVVAAVCLVVQQFDSDLLAPVVFGKALELHPLIILLAVTAGGALGGLAGAFLAVPVTAVVINVMAEARSAAAEDGREDPVPPEEASALQ